jgi:hypothetical protein
MVDAAGNIIASNGFTVATGTTLNSGIDIRVGDRIRSTETVVTATTRPFKFEVLESTNTVIGASFGPTGPVLVSSTIFDPASNVTPFLANCTGLPGGAPPLNSAPSFNDGTAFNLNISENASATSIVNQLDITDADTGDALTWSVTTAPTLGTLGGFNATATSNGGSVTPTGLTYTPNANQIGADSFVVQVSDGSLTDSFTFNVTIADTTAPTAVVSPLPATVNGAFSTTITFDEDVTGLTAAELTVVNGTASSLAGGPQVYTATITPTADGAVSVTVPANVAQDTAGNDNTASATVSTSFDGTAPTVIITTTATGVSGAGTFDVTVSFSEDVTGFVAADLTVVNGSITGLTGGPAIYTATVLAVGAGDVAISLTANMAADTAGNGNVVSNTLVISSQTIAETQRIIAEFQNTRANQLLQSQPGLTGFLSGANSGAFNADVTQGFGTFNFASKSGAPIWLRLNGNWSTEGSRETQYAFGALGSHYEVNPNLLIGGMVEFDYLDQADGNATVKGTGWLAGPYFVARIPDQPIFFEGRLLYGQTSNDITPFGTFTDTFDTERLLAQLKISGQYKFGGTILTPRLSASYTSDDQKAYTDSLGNLIPSQSIDLAQLELGMDFVTPMPFYTGAGKLDLTGGFAGIGSFTHSSGNPTPVVPEFEGGRGRVNLGLNYAMADRTRLVVDTFYDGIGVSGFRSYGLELGFDMKF